MASAISFEQAKKARLKDAKAYVIEMDPELLGLDPTALDLGVDEKGKPQTKVSLTYRGLTRDEYNEIVGDLKDEKDPIALADERDFAIVMRCLIAPVIPASAEGRKFIEGWLPGTLTNVRNQIERASGWRTDYVIRDAKEALANLGVSTPKGTSS